MSSPRLRLSIAVISLGIAGRAYAQSAEAEALFGDGDRLMAEGNLVAACEAFEASNHIEPRAGTMIRLGECREKNNQLASAWSAYKDALTRVKDPKKRAFAVSRITELEPKLSYLTISVPDESRVEGLEIARNGSRLDRIVWNRAVPVDGGRYIVVGRAPGHEEWQTTVDVPVEAGKVSVEVPKFKELAKLAPPKVEQPRAEHHVVTVTHTWSRRRKLALGVAGLGVASLVAGGVLGMMANSREHDAYALCPDPDMPCARAARAEELTASGHRLALGANVAFGVAGAATIGAVVLWFTGAPRDSRRLAIAPSTTGVTVLGRF